MPEQNFQLDPAQQGQRIALDAKAELYSPTEIGIPLQDNGNTFAIVGEIGINDNTKTTTAEAAIISVTGENEVQSLFLVGIVKDEQGRTSIANGNWTYLTPGEEFTVGRPDPKNPGGPEFIDGKTLVGTDFNIGVSRSHTKIKFEDGQVTIDDESINHTTLKGQEILNSREQVQTKFSRFATGSQVKVEIVMNDKPNLITAVPKSKDDFDKITIDIAAAKTAELNAKLAPISEELKKLTSGLPESDSIKLFRYSDSKSQKREAQQRSDGDMSIAYGSNIAEAYNSLSPRGKEVADQYDALIQRKEAITDRYSN
jgi:hypothetical protein